MVGLIGFALFVTSLLFGYTTARRFVRARLRYVDAIRSLRAPIVAGLGAAAVAMLPFAMIPLPFFTVGTAALFGLSVGVGVRAGAKDIRSSAGYIEGP
jgi:hypothetical protein